ncbi:probable transporter Mch1p [[Candida] jaroonii]|uniref:Probable transporter Mch1p n=1 Tax=[Candida] jaroonii TaxID=467808 RepID=A0ACA9Y9A6_9ASCO|nr:probable transporter Mch1p [[Candida] jaroonii]
MSAIHYSIKEINKYLPPTNHWLILASSVPVALSCGTVFAFSIYSTQLSEQCNLTTSNTSSLNISMVIGSALGGLIGGLVTDVFGTQLPMLLGCVTMFFGYKWLYELFNQGEDASLMFLIISMFFVGIGSTAGYFSAIKAVTIEFPNFKATAQSITIACFAISSLIISFIATHVFQSDIAAFLKFLYITCGSLNFIGFLFIRVEGHYKPGGEVFIEDNENEAMALLPSHSHPKTKNLSHLDLKESIMHPIFWYHFFMFSIIQGLGQMYIYQVGFIIKAVYNYYPGGNLHHLQALHVSLIAVCSFIGRLSSGPTSDFLVKSGFQRHWGLVLGLTIMLMGHLFNILSLDIFGSLHVANIFLSINSCLIGFAYGFSFTCYPAIISDIFNMKNYSFIWGLMYSSTAFGLTLMSRLFGFFYDLHSEFDGDDLVCFKGSGCYFQTFEITSSLCFLVICFILGYIYYRK